MRGVLAALASSGQVVHYDEVRRLCRLSQEQLGEYLGEARRGQRPDEADFCAVVVNEKGWPGEGFGPAATWPAKLRDAHSYWRDRRMMDKPEPAGALQWLLCAWPKGEEEPIKFWLSTLPVATSLKELVRCAKLRWRVERDYQEMKQELGLDHFEGRTWRGFHHHASLCAMAHGFLALRRALFPPEPGALDASHGQARSPASAPTPRWRLPSVPKTHR